ncbi:MAG TPA: cytochrome c [Alphaproteobacteria bacterium]|jgi:mono/diheme cytochrome c family protein|nr:cytochrome c [Alphaproteobacteria bacterium]
MVMKHTAIAAFAALLTGSFAGTALAVDFTPAGKTAGDGIFTTDQSKRGEAIYNANCAMCHQPDLGGKEPVPELAGDKFLSHWLNHPVAELFTRVSTTMPQGKPGSLTHQQYIDVIAFLIDANGFKSGTTELKPDDEALKTITISGNH